MYKRKINIHKILIFIFSFLMMSGFALLGSATWSISEADPTLWVKLCTASQTQVFSNDLNSASDSLGAVSANGAQALDSIMTDYNNISSSYIRLAAYPADPNNPGAPAAGDSTFTTAKAAVRTITVCINSAGGIATGGNATPTTSGKQITGCDIKIDPKNAKALKSFINTLTHELGHCAGLDHPMETKNAIMSYFHPSSYFRLMTDDKMGLVFLYPIAGIKAKEVNTFGLSCVKN